MKIQKIRIVIVIKGVFSYCLKFRPYMAIWMFFCTLAGVCTAIQKREVFALVIALVLAFMPAVLKKIILIVSRIGGVNQYDEKRFGKKPRGRFVKYLRDYVGGETGRGGNAISGSKQTVLRSKTDAMRSERTNLDY